MPLTVAACVNMFTYILIPLSHINTKSNLCILKQKRKTQRGLERANWRYFRPIQMQIGPFYSLKRSTVLTYFDFIVMNVIDILLL